MNNKEKHIVKGIHATSTIILILACVLVLSPYLKTSKNEMNKKSEKKAQALAYQIAAIHDKKMNRSTASDAGSIGMDPYGSPYSYQVQRRTGQIQVDIWSPSIKTSVVIPSENREFVQE